MLDALAATKVADIQRRAPVRLAPDTPLKEAVTCMREQRRGSALVEEEGRLLGIFTQRDLVTRVDLGDPGWQRRRLAEVMSPDPVTAPATASLAEALAFMAEGGFRTLPVVDDAGRVTGSVSIRDILRHLAENFPKEFLNLPPEPHRAAPRRWGG
jgi:CBS domain-containing protein